LVRLGTNWSVLSITLGMAKPDAGELLGRAAEERWNKREMALAVQARRGKRPGGGRGRKDPRDRGLAYDLLALTRAAKELTWFYAAAFKGRREAYRAEVRTARGPAADLGRLIEEARKALEDLDGSCRETREALAELEGLLRG
jgi:hypothetical protein